MTSVLAYVFAYFLKEFGDTQFLLASFSSLITFMHILSKFEEKFNVGSLFYFKIIEGS